MPSPQIPASSQEVSGENGVPPTSAESRAEGAPGGGSVKAHGQRRGSPDPWVMGSASVSPHPACICMAPGNSPSQRSQPWQGP